MPVPARFAAACATLFLLAAAPSASQDGSNGGGRICDNFNRCKKYTVRDKVKCPGCGKRSIYKEYALCTTCARKRDVCSRCGLGRTPREGGDDDGVSVENIRTILRFLASDELEGRQAGEPGGDRAADHIRSLIKGWGLEPGVDGDYFQHFDVRGGKKTQNVIGVWPGTSLKDQVVVAGAHYDHIGMAKPSKDDKGDRVYNGADDNASGTSTLLEVARGLAQSGRRLKRTIVFIWFSAEELGLLGSKHYCKEPIFPLDKTLAAVCMDMVGRNPDDPVDIKGLGSSADWQKIVEEAAADAALDANFVAAATGATDYLSFLDKKVPAIDFFSNKHPDYHKLGDEADKIDFEQCAAAGRAAARILAALGDREEKMEFIQPPRK